jgi:hypothetical protein
MPVIPVNKVADDKKNNNEEKGGPMRRKYTRRGTLAPSNY